MEINLKKVGSLDIEFLFELRNQVSTYRYSKDANPVAWEEHTSWIKPIVEGNSLKNLFVILVNKEKAGQVRVDLLGEEAEVHISLVPEFQGKGIAFTAIEQALIKINQEKGIRIFKAQTHQDNIPSQKLFIKLGFKLEGQEDIWKTYVKRN